MFTLSSSCCAFLSDCLNNWSWKSLILRLWFFSQDLDLYFRRRSRNFIEVEKFDPLSVRVDASPEFISWIDLNGQPAAPPDWESLPSPADVLSGRAWPDFNGLRLRRPSSFVCGNLHRFLADWDASMQNSPNYALVRSWIKEGVHIPSFFQHFCGEFGRRRFNSSSPPRMYFQNDTARCREFKDFITNTITLRLREGSIRCVGTVGVDPPPHVVNALSVEPIKPRLINSMRAVNLFCRDAPFSLTPLSDIVRNIPPGGFFSSFDDVQGYKHLSLTEESMQFCGFEWGGFWFVDTTLPFGWKLSAYVYTMTGNVLSDLLHSRGIHSELWIDDRFLGAAPPLS